MKSPELARELGVSRRTIQRWLKRAGVNPERSQLTDEQCAWADEAAAEGVPRSWIAETLGCPRWTIEKRMTRLGIPSEPEWKGTQLAARRTGAISALHKEFSPR